MNILTKICVVLLLVASLIASVVFISMATVGPNWRAKHDDKDKKARLYMGDAKEAKRALNASKTRVAELEKQLVTMEEKKKSDLDAKNLRIAEITREKEGLQAAIKDNNLQLSSINKTAKVNTSLVTSLRKELAESRKIQNEKAARVAHLTEELNEEKARGVRLNKSLRSALVSNEDLKRTIAGLNTKLEAMEKYAGKGAEDIAQDTPPATRVTATISDVSDNLASINVGSAHGLKAGMKLIVYRGSKFVGWLKLEQVAADEAAGVMVDKQCEPMRGDKVTSSLE